MGVGVARQEAGRRDEKRKKDDHTDPGPKAGPAKQLDGEGREERAGPAGNCVRAVLRGIEAITERLGHRLSAAPHRALHGSDAPRTGGGR